jgi:hypothetical protein
MGESHPHNHPLWSRFSDFVDGHPTWTGVREVADEHTFAAWSLYLAGVEAGAAQEKDNGRRESATDRTNAAAVERLCATMRGLPAAPGWRVTTVWGTFDAGPAAD